MLRGFESHALRHGVANAAQIKSRRSRTECLLFHYRFVAPPFPRKAVAGSQAKPFQVWAFNARSRFVLFAGGSKAAGGSLFGCKAGFERAAEQGGLSNCSGNSCLARGRESLSRKCGCSRARRESVPELSNILCRFESKQTAFRAAKGDRIPRSPPKSPPLRESRIGGIFLR